MKKLGLLILGGIAVIILLANLVPLALLALSVVVLYYSFKSFMKATSSLSKVMWAALGLIILTVTISNIPALVGIIAAIILYFVYKSWKDEKVETKKIMKKEEHDPFVNFENEWNQLNSN